MPLQTSGQISLDDIHQEAGGSANTTAGLNDADIRGLISKGAGAEAAFSDYYGASSVAPSLLEGTGTISYGGTPTSAYQPKLRGIRSAIDFSVTSGAVEDIVNSSMSSGSIGLDSMQNFNAIGISGQSHVTEFNFRIANNTGGVLQSFAWSTLEITTPASPLTYTFYRAGASVFAMMGTFRWIWTINTNGQNGSPFFGGTSGTATWVIR